MTGPGKKFLAAIGLAGALVLGGCAYDDGYGYGGVSVGTGYYGGGGYYGDGLYGPTGYYQPGLYNGWYNNYYYPGTGIYVYDRGGRRQRWNDGQRRYWEGRRVESRTYRGDGRRDGQWQGRDRDGRDGRWQGRDGQPGNGNWSNRTRTPQGVEGDRGRGNWRGNAVRPTPDGTPQAGFRNRSQSNQIPGTSPQVNQSRPQRDQGFRSAPSARSDRSMRSRGGEQFRRTRPD